MRRYLVLLPCLLLMGLYSPAQVSSLGVVATQSNGGVVPTYTTHTLTIENDCRLQDHMQIEIECGEDGTKHRSELTAGTVLDAEPPICVTTYLFENACLRLQDGIVDDVIRIYDRKRNAIAYRKSVEATSSLSDLVFTYAYAYPASGNLPTYDPTLAVIVDGGADADYFWYGDCDDNPSTGGDGGYEVTFGDNDFYLQGHCPLFTTAGTHRIRILVKDENAVCGVTPCLSIDLFATAIDPRIELESLVPSTNTGPAPLTGVEFDVALNTETTTVAYAGVWDLAISCGPAYTADCGVGDQDCDTADGCCYVENIAGATYSTVPGAFQCDYTDPGSYMAVARAYYPSVPFATTFTNISVGQPPSFSIQPIPDTTHGYPTNLITMQNPSCSGTATGAITQATLTWALGTEAAAPVALLADCTWDGAAPSKQYATSGAKVARLCATRANVTDCSDITIQIDPATTLGAVVSPIPAQGQSPHSVDISVLFTGDCPGPWTIFSSRCGDFCSGQMFNVANTVNNPYVVTGACTCTTGTSVPSAIVMCEGAPNAYVQGTPPIVVSSPTEESFGISPVTNVTAGTAGSTTVTVTGVLCSGTATGPITASAVPVDGQILGGLTLEKGVRPAVTVGITSACVLQAPLQSTIYSTPGPKTVEICATRAGVRSCGTSIVNINPAQQISATLSPNPAADTPPYDGVLNDIDIDVSFVLGGNNCPGPWTISNSSCGSFCTGSFNGTVSAAHTFVDVCDCTTGTSSPSATVSCGTATPVQASLDSSIVVDPPAGGPTFELSVSSVPASGPADSLCDADSCYLLSDIAVTCGGTAVGPITDGTIAWAVQPPFPFNFFWTHPLIWSDGCNADVAWNTSGIRYPEGTWEYEVCAVREGVGDCTIGSVTATDPGQEGPNFTVSGITTASASVTLGQPDYLVVPPGIALTIRNAGTGAGSYTCSTTPPDLLSAVATLPFKQVVGLSTNTLQPGESAGFLVYFDHRGVDQLPNTLDDTPVSVNIGELKCVNDANGGNEVKWPLRFEVIDQPHPDLEASVNALEWNLIYGQAPTSKSFDLYSVGGQAAVYTTTTQYSGPGTPVTCTNESGTAPVYSNKITVVCTPASGLAVTSQPIVVTKTVSRTGASPADTEVVTLTINVASDIPTGMRMEQRCSDLGSGCVCSEPLNTTTRNGGQSWSMIGQVYDNWGDPDDSEGKECRSASGGGSVLQRPGYGTNPGLAPIPAAQVPLPATATVSYVLRQVQQPVDTGDTPHVSTDSWSGPPGYTDCLRTYIRWDPDSPVPQLGGATCPQSGCQYKIMSYGINGGGTSGGPVQLSINPDGGHFGLRFDVYDFTGGQAGFESGWPQPDQTVAQMNNCRNNFCRVEICMDFRSDGRLRARGRTDIIPSKFAGGATPATGYKYHSYGPVARTILNSDSPSIILNYNPGMHTGFIDWTMAMEARVPFNEGFWIGPACEIEGTGGVPGCPQP